MAYSSGIKCIFQPDIPCNSEVALMIGFQPRRVKALIAPGCVLKLPPNEKAYFKTHSNEPAKTSLLQINEAHLRGNLGTHLRAEEGARNLWVQNCREGSILNWDDGLGGIGVECNRGVYVDTPPPPSYFRPTNLERKRRERNVSDFSSFPSPAGPKILKSMK